MSTLSVSTTYTQTDQFFDVCTINGTKFALIHNPLIATTDLEVDLKDYNVVLLAPITAENNVCMNAKSIVVLSDITAKKGEAILNASGKLITSGDHIKSHGKNVLLGKSGVYLMSVPNEGALERIKCIREEFQRGISNLKGELIQEALVDTFDAVQDPYVEGDGEISVREAFVFFGIGLRV